MFPAPRVVDRYLYTMMILGRPAIGKFPAPREVDR